MNQYRYIVQQYNEDKQMHIGIACFEFLEHAGLFLDLLKDNDSEYSCWDSKQRKVIDFE